MFASVQEGFSKWIVSLVGCSDDHQLDLWIGQHLIQGPVDLDVDSESFLDLSAWGLGVALKNGVQGEHVGQGEDKRYMERQPRQTDSENTSVDRTSHGRVL